MFDYKWSVNNIDNLENNILRDNLIIPSMWCEHCVECSAPECYKTCKIYKKRKDGACVRINNGISPFGRINNKKTGAKISFRKWGKIESGYYPFYYHTDKYEKIEKRFLFFNNIYNKLLKSSLFFFKNISSRYFNRLERKYFKKIAMNGIKANNIYLHINAKSNNELKLILEIKNSEGNLYRNNISINKDFYDQYISIPQIESNNSTAILIYPENINVGNEIEILTLELIEKENEQKKIKCVIWDLDNTLWDGILSENGDIKIKQEIVNIIKDFDEKGIINSICSKNNENDVTKKLKEFNVYDYFVFKKINWNPKSVNINKTIKEMNISPDTIAFIDDMKFEREEVLSTIPNITCIDPLYIKDFLSSDRLKIKISDESKKRRLTYQMLEKQKNELEEWTGSIDEFLKQCKMQVFVRHPQNEDYERCHELILRTNQLNSSGRRLSIDEIKGFCMSDKYNTYLISCLDKYGDYGQVGFIIMNVEKIVTVTDFVLSCRVANKKIENTVLKKLFTLLKLKKMNFMYKKTPRNTPIYNVIKNLQMELKYNDNGYDIYEWDGKTYDDVLDIIQISVL